MEPTVVKPELVNTTKFSFNFDFFIMLFNGICVCWQGLIACHFSLLLDVVLMMAVYRSVYFLYDRVDEIYM